MIQKVAKNLKEQIGMLSWLWYLEWEDMQVEGGAVISPEKMLRWARNRMSMKDKM